MAAAIDARTPSRRTEAPTSASHRSERLMAEEAPDEITEAIRDLLLR
ncbi:hypothetical protein [Streptomyces bluensis]|uniref:Uncharacterized protein n=1 Tax=Streptomyces bluensis TaxID=33897 RepID=A0ABW6UAX9_9ACTN